MNKKINVRAVSLAAGTLLVFAALPAFAAELNVSVNGGVNVGSGSGTNASATVTASGEGRTVRTDLIGRVETKADQEISRREGALNRLSLRVSEMKKLSDDEKGNFSAELKAQIDAMAALQAKIAADADANATSSLRDDIKSITASYRIFLLIIPKGAIEAAADRVMATVSVMQDLGTKLQARIAAAQASSTDVSAAVTAMADFNAKILDAQTQAKAATTEVAGLMPDNGVQATFAANLTALKDARTKILAAQKDLIAARDDARATIKVFASLKVNASSTVTNHDD